MGKTKIILVSFLKPKPPSFEFSTWPNHITIVPFFNTFDPETLTKEIKGACQNLDKIPYKVDSIDYFGPRKNAKVSIVKGSKELSNLHSLLLNIALKHDGKMNTSFCRSRYRSHITHNDIPHPQENDEGIIKEIYVVEYLSPNTKTPDTEKKKVIGVSNLR